MIERAAGRSRRKLGDPPSRRRASGKIGVRRRRSPATAAAMSEALDFGIGRILAPRGLEDIAWRGRLILAPERSFWHRATRSGVEWNLASASGPDPAKEVVA
jgi:hypothetical protein